MKGVIFHGIGDISLEEIDVPTVQNASDAIVRITLTTICGSDLHLIHGQTVVDPESPIGHECVGVIEEVGDDVSSFKPGDRVVVATFPHCGNCFFCKKGSPSQCEKGGILGFGSIRGGLGGAQTEYVRVPYADMSLVKTPDSLSDEDVLFVGDILATAYFALENVPIHPGDTVVIVHTDITRAWHRGLTRGPSTHSHSSTCRDSIGPRTHGLPSWNGIAARHWSMRMPSCVSGDRRRCVA